MPRGRVSEKTSSLINNNLSSVIKEYLRPDTEFWDSSKTLKVLAEEEYFKCDDEVVWPECLQKMMSDGRTNLKVMDKIQCTKVYKYQELYIYVQFFSCINLLILIFCGFEDLCLKEFLLLLFVNKW